MDNKTTFPYRITLPYAVNYIFTTDTKFTFQGTIYRYISTIYDKTDLEDIRTVAIFYDCDKSIYVAFDLDDVHDTDGIDLLTINN